jgi:glycosyltransferase involved in cell wall biosynthesis
MKRLKVLLFSRYSRLGPSSRLRSLQYLPLLQDRGIDVEAHALFPDTYLEKLYGDHPEAARRGAWRHYVRRIGQVLHHDRHDVAWIEGELFPYLPHWLESPLARAARPYVVDYDDALFHKYDLSSSPLVRRVLGDKIDQVMRGAACVVAGNRYLAARAAQAGARRIEIIPTVVDEKRYPVVDHADVARPVIGWVGSPATEEYLLDNREVLEQVCTRHHARLLLVGPRTEVAGQFGGLEPEVVAWSEDSEAATIARMDIGIMPLRDGPWERGKCGYKIIQYMACGLPVVASTVGANIDIVRHGENGFLASGTAAWRDGLERLILSRPLRTRMGRAGRARVEDEYNVTAQASRLAEVLRSAGSH